MSILKSRHTHAQRLERWIGPEQVASISNDMKYWVGPPIPLVNVPGKVYARAGGDFTGPIYGGKFSGLTDYYLGRGKYPGRVKQIVNDFGRKQASQCNVGFSSLSDLISEATANTKQQNIFFSKVGTATAIHNRTLWPEAGFPGIGTVPSVRPGGDVPNNTTTGGLQQIDPTGGDTLHLLTVQSFPSAAPNVLLLYDRLFHASGIAHTNNASQTITGTPTRYSSTATAPGNFFFLEVTNTLGATAHTILINYTDNSNNAAENSGTTTIVVSSTAGRVPHAQFFVPLNAGDTGLLNVTALTFSAVSSGTSNSVIGHTYCFIPQPLTGGGVVLDGLNSAFNLIEVKTDACMAILELKGVASATTYTGSVVLVSG